MGRQISEKRYGKVRIECDGYRRWIHDDEG